MPQISVLLWHGRDLLVTIGYECCCAHLFGLDDGRSFWDCETWMFPILDLFSEPLGESLLRYRLERLPAALDRAVQYGLADGAAMFPWTSTQSGFGTTQQPMGETCTGASCTGLDWQEQHITGDICAMRKMHMLTCSARGMDVSSVFTCG